MMSTKYLLIATTILLSSFFVGCASRHNAALSLQPNDVPEQQIAQNQQPVAIQQVGFEQPVRSANREPLWHESFEEARRESSETGKPILAAFSGSDWCPPCKKLKTDVFETQQFRNWANENVVLLDLDFPKHKPQPQSIRVQNQQLAQQFEIQGYPTVVFLGENNQQLGRMGFASNVDQWLAGAKAQLR